MTIADATYNTCTFANADGSSNNKPTDAHFSRIDHRCAGHNIDIAAI